MDLDVCHRKSLIHSVKGGLDMDVEGEINQGGKGMRKTWLRWLINISVQPQRFGVFLILIFVFQKNKYISQLQY